MKADVIVIGGGASGLVAAICAARCGSDVLILERMPKIGKKLLATGNGRCNYTNTRMNDHCYHSHYHPFINHILEQFNTDHTIDFFKDLGILPKSNDGYIYPNSLQAASILDCLRYELDYLNVRILTDCDVKSVQKTKKGFRVMCGSESHTSRQVILSCGGKASQKLGSNGSGYTIAKELGHHIIPIVPALTGLKAKEKIYKTLSGIRTEARVSLYIDEKLVDEDLGEVQLAEYGISGIPVFQISGQAAYGLYEKKKVECFLDFFPHMSFNELYEYISERLQRFKGRSTEVFETGLLNRKLIQACIKLANGNSTPKQSYPSRLTAILKKFPATIIESRGYDFAQVCAGGIDLHEISWSHCESRLVPGLYITGELMDVDGICGGYNLQWAWATGCLAGTAAGKDNHDSN